ncbi:MAG: hypothetical protein LBH48_03080, partial [Bifidobacteriaceae bacterium]|jgi:hypothetical protein|nr:hypothetical protein [Bifidobacteriaceae bacterium]
MFGKDLARSELVRQLDGVPESDGILTDFDQACLFEPLNRSTQDPTATEQKAHSPTPGPPGVSASHSVGGVGAHVASVSYPSGAGAGMSVSL